MKLLKLTMIGLIFTGIGHFASANLVSEWKTNSSGALEDISVYGEGTETESIIKVVYERTSDDFLGSQDFQDIINIDLEIDGIIGGCYLPEVSRCGISNDLVSNFIADIYAKHYADYFCGSTRSIVPGSLDHITEISSIEILSGYVGTPPLQQTIQASNHPFYRGSSRISFSCIPVD